MYLYTPILTVIFFLLAFDTAKSQSYYFKHYQVEEGLAHNSVITQIQDSKGFMWIGTKGGLNRFDGYTFKTFRNDKNKFGTIGNNIIVSIDEDKRGMIWVGTGRGIFKYDPYLETFKELVLAVKGGITYIRTDKRNNLWFLAEGWLHHYNQQQDKVTNIGLAASCLTLGKQGNIWLGRNDGTVLKYDPDTKKVSSMAVLDKNLPPQEKFITKVFDMGKDSLLIGTSKLGVRVYDVKTGARSALKLGNESNLDLFIRDILMYGDSEYWFATESGIFNYNFKTKKSEKIVKRNGDKYGLTDNAVYSLCKDKQGGLWAGTFFGGLNYYSKEGARFKKYYPTDDKNSISGNAIREICSDELGNLWIGTEDAGINKFNPRTGQFTSYLPNGKSTGLSYTNIHGLLAYQNRLYIGPFIRGMEIMDIKTGLITDRFKLIGENKSKVSDFVMCIYLTSDSTLLIGTTGNQLGLFSFNPLKKTFKRYGYLPDGFDVYALLEDHEGTIWAGSPGSGTSYFNIKTGKKGTISFSDKDDDSQFDHDYLIQGIYEDSNRCLWFATDGGGLIRLGADRRTIKKYTTENGLPTNSVYRILEDNSKNLWISSLKGLIRLNLKTEVIKVYTQYNGLVTDQFNYNSAYKAANGEMFFGTVKGMISFKPEEFVQTKTIVPSYITGFQINNKDVVPNTENSPLSKSVSYTDTLVLNHDQTNFSIEFAAINYTSPEATRYKYQMKGLDKEWTYLRNNRKAYFTGLSAGSYTFVMQAESNDGSWTSKEQRLFILILPPLWKSKPAFMLYITLIIIALYLSFRYYHLYLQRKNSDKLRMFEYEKEKEIYQAKIEFFTNITHEIQTPLTLIVGPLALIMERINEFAGIKRSLTMMEQNAKRLLELTGQLLDFRKTEINQFGLNFVNVNISEILAEQVEVFRQEAIKTKIELSFEQPLEPVIAFVDKEAFLKISSNLISNAIKYAGTTASIEIIPNGEDTANFTIRFSNDGPGISKEFSEDVFKPFFRMPGNKKPGTGIGLALAKSLTDLHSGSLKLASTAPHHTVFELTLPLRQKFEFKVSSWKKFQEKAPQNSD
ncbi:ligand-binding sensor domain-containing protein [Desertivirga brevis]|uniref:ligand-binding sensor domain-containing protein n=1 Tax=Desertivirga brevis TaxID=2810310 RepID=UPI001A9683A5|nr:sensor histidine kinase [Pedobacter sp. SYSU D00873]